MKGLSLTHMLILLTVGALTNAYIGVLGPETLLNPNVWNSLSDTTSTPHHLKGIKMRQTQNLFHTSLPKVVLNSVLLLNPIGNPFQSVWQACIVPAFCVDFHLIWYHSGPNKSENSFEWLPYYHIRVQGSSLNKQIAGVTALSFSGNDRTGVNAQSNFD